MSAADVAGTIINSQNSVQLAGVLIAAFLAGVICYLVMIIYKLTTGCSERVAQVVQRSADSNERLAIAVDKNTQALDYLQRMVSK